MKKLAFAVALMLSSASHAETWEAPNTQGGKIVLTNRKGMCENGFFAYNTTGAGKLSTGCWQFADDRVWMFYDDGPVRVYELDSFNVRKDHNEQQEKPAKSKKQYQSM